MLLSSAVTLVAFAAGRRAVPSSAGGGARRLGTASGSGSSPASSWSAVSSRTCATSRCRPPSRCWCPPTGATARTVSSARCRASRSWSPACSPACRSACSGWGTTCSSRWSRRRLALTSCSCDPRARHRPRARRRRAKAVDFRGAIPAVRAVPGLFALILFSTFNNLVGGVFMALMDPYGLELQRRYWGVVLGITSTRLHHRRRHRRGEGPRWRPSAARRDRNGRARTAFTLPRLVVAVRGAGSGCAWRSSRRRVG